MKNYFKVCLVLITVFFLIVCCAFADEFKFTKTVIYPFDKNMDNGRIELSTTNGSLNVIPVKDENCKIEINYTIKEKNMSSAEALADKATKISKTSNGLFCAIKYQKEKIKNFNFFKKDTDSEICASIKAYIPAKYLYNTVFNTVNGAVLVKDFRCLSNDTATVNGAIELNISAKKIKTATVNGSIFLDVNSLFEQTVVSSDTVNGKITINTKKQKDAGIYIKAATVNGKISTDIKGLKNKKNENFFGIANSLEGQTGNFDTAKYKVTIRAHTVNGKITIGEK